MRHDIPLLAVTVPVPTDLPRRRGRAAINRFMTKIPIRMGEFDRSVVERAAELQGVTITMFCRHAALHVAAKILEHEDGLKPTVDP